MRKSQPDTNMYEEHTNTQPQQNIQAIIDRPGILDLIEFHKGGTVVVDALPQIEPYVPSQDTGGFQVYGVVASIDCN